ncbi:MAG: hypothetical protein V4671_23140 [Armatimonadota bacterium]
MTPNLFPLVADPRKQTRDAYAKRALALMLGMDPDASDLQEMPTEHIDPLPQPAPRVPVRDRSMITPDSVLRSAKPEPEQPTFSSAATRGEDDPMSQGSQGIQGGQGISPALRRYLYQQMPQAPRLPDAPERDFRGEAIRSGVGALVSGLVLKATGNGAAVSPAIAAYLQGAQRGNASIAQNQDQEYRQGIAKRLQDFQLKRQAVEDENDATAFQISLDDKQQQQQSRDRQAAEQTRRADADDTRMAESGA